MREVRRFGMAIVVTAIAASPAAAQPPSAAVLETFVNTWHTSTIGLDFNPGAGEFFYAHEGIEEDAATLWDVDFAAPHTSGPSYDLAALNSGFPVSLNNRNDVAYDASANSYFLTDYQGDLIERDDNIVEIDTAGTILNAWELDGAGNDSSDATAVDQILGIAIVPGATNRYFVAAFEGSGVIREIALTRSGIWVAASWNTVNTCTVPDIGDSAGLDYDEASGHLFVSSGSNEIVSEVDLSCNVIAQFVCDGPGTFHTGIAFIEGANPPQVWVTDFNSNATTRCAIPPALFADGFESGDTGAWSSTFPPA